MTRPPGPRPIRLRVAAPTASLPSARPAQATPMSAHSGARAIHAVRVADPADPAAISAALPGASTQVNDGCVEVATASGRCFAHVGQWVVYNRATGAVRAVDHASDAG